MSLGLSSPCSAEEHPSMHWTAGELSLGSLPDACLAQVLGNLPATDLLTAALANKRLNKLTADPTIWR